MSSGMSSSTLGARRVVLVVAALSLMLSPAASGAAEPPETRVPNMLMMDTLRSGRTTVDASALDRGTGSSRSVCVSARRVRQGSRFRVVTEQFGCSEELDLTYSFDPLLWTAGVRGTITQSVTRDTYELVDGEWLYLSGEGSTAAADIDLRWLGEGLPGPNAGYSGFPGSCYAFPPVCTTVHAGVGRPAIVSGSLTFDGLDASFSVPRGHGGAMHLIEGPSS